MAIIVRFSSPNFLRTFIVCKLSKLKFLCNGRGGGGGGEGEGRGSGNGRGRGRGKQWGGGQTWLLI